MAETTNYKLYVVDEGTEKFIDWRKKIAGETNSNFTKIDEALSKKQDEITGNEGEFVVIGSDGKVTTKALVNAEDVSF